MVETRFGDALLKDLTDKGLRYPGEPSLCATPIRWLMDAFDSRYHFARVRSLDDMFARPGMARDLSEFFLMDVILNRELTCNTEDGPRDPDEVVMATAKRDPANLEPESDFKYRTLIAFLPGAGVFYCARERRPSTVGCAKSLVQLDASWLRITEDASAPSNGRRFSFGADSYVRRFSDESTHGLPISHWVSAWKVSSSGVGGTQERLVHLASQCLDSDGPRMPPDIIGGDDIGVWSAPERAAYYNEELASSRSAKVGGRHYARGCLHLRIPDGCLVIDGAECPHVDIVVDIANAGSYRNRKSVVMVRNLLSPSMEATFVGRANEPLLVHELQMLTLHNSLLRKNLAIGGARNFTGDVGTMHPIGTRVMPNGLTTSAYCATSKVPRRLVQGYVHALSRVGQIAFPDVLAVIQDTEGDTGLQPCPAMAGDDEGNRVGFSIDSSDGLANASHIDGNDASQCFTTWLEEKPGTASDWHFVMPNLHGVSADGKPFNGVAVKLRHGTAISWDGRIIRHCTSLFRPDGPGTAIVGEGCANNHVYGTFTAAKERLVNFGRWKAAMLKEMEDFAYDGDGVVFHIEDDREEVPPYNPKIEDADPDDDHVPRDGTAADWLGWYGRRFRERQAAEKEDVDDDLSLFTQDLDDDEVHNDRNIVSGDEGTIAGGDNWWSGGEVGDDFNDDEISRKKQRF
jgi:hypothetical protein